MSRSGDRIGREQRGVCVWGWERKQLSVAKGPTKNTKGRRMTGTRVKPAQKNEEEGNGKDGQRGRGEGKESPFSHR